MSGEKPIPHPPAGIKVEPLADIQVPRSLTAAQIRDLVGPKRPRQPRIPSKIPNAWEIPPNVKRDQVLDRLAKELGFQSKNVLARVMLSEISYCPKTAFFKAIGQFTRYTRTK